MLRWEEHGTGRARIVDGDPPHRFSYRWAPIREHWGEEPDAGNSTLVEFTLVAEGWEIQLGNVRRYAENVGLTPFWTPAGAQIFRPLRARPRQPG